MKINGYQKNKYYYNKGNNNIYPNNSINFFHHAKNSLFEVENFLCNLKKFSKCMNLYKFFK